MASRPHIVWPAAIILLLLLSGVTTFAVLIASRSDGGAQVVGDYYRKSVAWDSLAAVRRASDDLGWTARVEISRETSPPSAIIQFADAEGAPVAGLTGSVAVSRPQSVVTYGTHSFSADRSEDGAYAFSFPYSEHGLWDLNVVAARDGDRFIERIRIEI